MPTYHFTVADNTHLVNINGSRWNTNASVTPVLATIGSNMTTENTQVVAVSGGEMDVLTTGTATRFIVGLSGGELALFEAPTNVTP